MRTGLEEVGPTVVAAAGSLLGETSVDRRTTGHSVPRCGLRVTTQVSVRGRKTTRDRCALVENGSEGLWTMTPLRADGCVPEP